jgi:glutamate/tyrosine decarboxylase-like PLP-dependent enzyme
MDDHRSVLRSRQVTQPQLDRVVADLARRFREALDPPDRAGVAIDAAEMRARLDEPLPESGAPLDALLGELADRAAPGLTGSTGGRYFGYVTGGVLPAAAVAQAWAIALDQNPGLWTLAPAASELELVALGWLAELLSYPAGGATFTSGAAGANLVGLAVARHWFGARHGVDVATAGVGELPRLAVYASDQVHLTDVKALRTLGLGSDCLRLLPTDEDYRLRIPALVRAIDRDRAAGIVPAIVIGTAGTANTGATDDLGELARLRDEHELWLHVDGAFGSFFRLDERIASSVDGLERADSLAVDGHKWLNLPNGTGFAFVADGQLHRATFAGTAPYLTPALGAGADLHELGVEASRPWRGVAAWAALKALGREGIAELVERCCTLTRELVSLVEASPRLELTAPAPTCVACFRYRPAGWGDGPRLDELNRGIQQEVASAGDVFATGASLANGFSIRACIVSWRTGSEDVQALAEAVETTGDRLAARA